MLKKLLMFFSKESFPYVLGNKDPPPKNLYISGNGSHQKNLIF